MNAEDLAAILDELGRRLGPAGEYVFRLAVQRVVISSSVTIAFGLILMAAAGLYTRFALGQRRKAQQPKEISPGYTSYSSSDSGEGWLFSLFAPAIVGILGLLFVGDSLVDLLTPEYTALRDILAAVGGTK